MEKATETVSFRLTRYEKRLLDHLAAGSGMSKTDLIRDLLGRLAQEQGVEEIPEAPLPKRPGRPPKPRGVVDIATEIDISVRPRPLERILVASKGASTSVLPDPPPDLLPDLDKKGTFGDLVARFRDHFSSRADGTRGELEETVDFIMRGEEPIIPPTTELVDLTGDRLQGIRGRVRASNVRFSRKNLYLTYLRMMFSFGAKIPLPGLPLIEEGQLRAFTAKELSDAWPGLGGSDRGES